MIIIILLWAWNERWEMRPLSLVTQLANLAGVGYNDNDVIIMCPIIAMVDEWHGGGMPPDIAIGGTSRACLTRSCPDMAVRLRHSRMRRWWGHVNNTRMTRPRRSRVGRIVSFPFSPNCQTWIGWRIILAFASFDAAVVQSLHLYIRNWQQGDIDGSWNCEIVMTLRCFGLKNSLRWIINSNNTITS